MPGIPVFVAILVGLVSSFVQSLGLTIQRKSHLLDSSLPLSQRRRPIRRPLWLLGFGIYITSNIFSTIFQLDSLPIVILAPLGAISLIYNAVLARIMLGDKFGKTWIMGTGLIALGAVSIAVFGVVNEGHHSLDEVLLLFRRGAFVGFFSVMSLVTAGVIVVSHITSYHIHRQLSRIQLPDNPNETGSSTPTSLVPSNYASPHSNSQAIPFRSRPAKKSNTLRRWSSPTSPVYNTVPLPRAANSNSNNPEEIQIPKHHLHLEIPSSNPNTTQPNESQQRTLTLCGLGFASASGTLSGMCLVLAKAAVELLVLSINHFRTGEGKNEFLRIQTWFLVLGLGVCAILQLVYLNYSLTFASPAIICPLAFCFFNLSSIFDGLVFYDQFSRLSILQITFVSLGVAILLLGVWVVSAIQPDAGVDIGTWVEEESDTESIMEDIEQNPFLQTESPTQTQVNPLSPTIPDPLSRSSIFPSNEQGTPEALHRSVFSNPEHPSTPTSPMSPTTRRRHHHHRLRYGSLIPDALPTGAPTGFSIGLGASSPGFALRSGSFSIDGNFHPHHPSAHSPLLGQGDGWGRHGHVRSRSEGQRGFSAIVSGQDDGGYEARTEEEDAVGDVGENTVEGELREWTERDENGDVKRKAWWERLFGRELRGQGKVRLEGDERT
ncbi:hypothetical protein I302_106166 [Kwoniella bestiolae CBS 10118]|uniref:Uncharacterized protein n=1 Tax=Kwoniella bestiolae CBS 10118 TaxID=1296100 RepID=A0A1B9G363_9TREE|nr:hypothetical protein I302_05289 [Kwoniella bestiolae CBS 10118]OCF25469.1 hypothetical protein I302_05289 [Kwoniella bestiolae CBS 10118]